MQNNNAITSAPPVLADHSAETLDLMGYADAARALGVPLGTLYAWVSTKRIPHHRLGPRIVKFSRHRLALWIDEARVDPT